MNILKNITVTVFVKVVDINQFNQDIILLSDVDISNLRKISEHIKSEVFLERKRNNMLMVNIPNDLFSKLGLLKRIK